MLLVAVLMAFHVADRAGAGEPRCRTHLADARERAGVSTGTGASTVVVGDSWSVGLGLDDLAESWPSRLPGPTRVAGFSGSGFSPRASTCSRAAFADRAAAALRPRPGLVVVQGGLNDHDQPDAAVAQGFERLMRTLAGHRVVVVGPAAAPARADAVPRVDRLLARLAAAHDVPYVRTSDLALPYLGDDLHLSPAGHVAFGDAVAQRLDAVIARPGDLPPAG